MERLTEKIDEYNRYFIKEPAHLNCSKVVQRLGAYEDAEEQGLLLRLPCKVGTQVWKIKECSGGGRIPNWHEIYNINFALELLSDFGKTVFLTREEAEKALADMVV